MNRSVTIGGLLAAVFVTIALSLGGALGVATYLDTPGPQGVAGQTVVGPQGDKGERGVRGRSGRDGKNGVNGANGAAGAPGATRACSNDLTVALPFC